MNEMDRIPKKQGGLKKPVGIFFRCDDEMRAKVKEAVKKHGITANEIIYLGLVEELKRLGCW